MLIRLSMLLLQAGCKLRSWAQPWGWIAFEWFACYTYSIMFSTFFIAYFCSPVVFCTCWLRDGRELSERKNTNPKAFWQELFAGTSRRHLVTWRNNWENSGHGHGKLLSIATHFWWCSVNQWVLFFLFKNIFGLDKLYPGRGDACCQSQSNHMSQVSAHRLKLSSFSSDSSGWEINYTRNKICQPCCGLKYDYHNHNLLERFQSLRFVSASRADELRQWTGWEKSSAVPAMQGCWVRCDARCLRRVDWKMQRQTATVFSLVVLAQKKHILWYYWSPKQFNNEHGKVDVLRVQQFGPMVQQLSPQ